MLIISSTSILGEKRERTEIETSHDYNITTSKLKEDASSYSTLQIVQNLESLRHYIVLWLVKRLTYLFIPKKDMVQV